MDSVGGRVKVVEENEEAEEAADDRAAPQAGRRQLLNAGLGVLAALTGIYLLVNAGPLLRLYVQSPVDLGPLLPFNAMMMILMAVVLFWIAFICYFMPPGESSAGPW